MYTEEPMLFMLALSQTRSHCKKHRKVIFCVLKLLEIIHVPLRINHLFSIDYIEHQL